MTVHAQILKPIRVFGGTFCGPEVHRVGADVSEAALQDFSNFVQQLAASASRAGEMKQHPETCTTHLRRSKRLTRLVEPNVPTAGTVRPTQDSKVRDGR